MTKNKINFLLDKNLFMKIQAFLFILLLLYSCREVNKSMDYYLSEIEDKLTYEELSELENRKGLELIEYIKSQFSVRVFEDSVHIEYAHALDTLLEDKGITNEKYKFPAIYMAIHYRLNKLEIPYSNINIMLEGYYDRQYQEEINLYKEMSAKAKLNYDRFEVKDTVCLLFPIEITERGNNVILYEEKYYDIDSTFGDNRPFIQWEDTLILKGILMEKVKKEFDIDTSILRYSFFMEILSLNKSNNLNSTVGSLEEGNSLELYLNEYLREIGDCD